MFGIIDKDGRLFGKINIVDFLIIVIFLILIPIFFHVYKIMSKAPPRVPSKWVRVEAVIFTLPEIAELFTPGDRAADEFGTVDAKLVRIIKKTHLEGERLKNAMVNKYIPAQKRYNINTQYEFRVPVFIEFSLLCTRADEGGFWYFRRQALSLGLNRTFLFNTGKYRIKCYPIKITD